MVSKEDLRNYYLYRARQMADEAERLVGVLRSTIDRRTGPDKGLDSVVEELAVQVTALRECVSKAQGE